jgi:hypothetical protein
VENRHEPVDDREAVARRVSAAIRTLSAGVSSLYTNHSEAFFKTASYPAEGKLGCEVQEALILNAKMLVRPRGKLDIHANRANV